MKKAKTPAAAESANDVECLKKKKKEEVTKAKSKSVKRIKRTKTIILALNQYIYLKILLRGLLFQKPELSRKGFHTAGRRTASRKLKAKRYER